MLADAATITLSQEEVYFLLDQMSARGLFGLDFTPLMESNANQRRELLAAAGRALQARGFISADEGAELLLDDTVRTTLHTSAFAPVSLTALVRRAEGELLEAYIVHHAEPIWVEHTQPAPGLHQFALSSGPPAVPGRLMSMLGVKSQDAPDARPFTIESTQLERITSSVTGDGPPLVEELTAAGADRATAELFAGMLTGPRDAALVQVIDRRTQTESVNVVTFIHNQQGYWILEPTSPSHLSCCPAGADDVRRSLASLANQL